MRIDEITDLHLITKPNYTAVSDKDFDISYKALTAASDMAAALLKNKGIKKGDRVAILAKNSAAYPVIIIAAAKLGAVSVLLNHRLQESELDFIIDDCKASLIVTTDKDLHDTALNLQKRRKEDLHLVNINRMQMKFWLDIENICQSDQLIKSENTATESSDFLQLYTSGTTGRPKGAILTHRNFKFIVNKSPDSPSDIDNNSLIIAPLFHIGGAGSLLISLMTAGSAIIHEQFDPHQMINTMEQRKLRNVFMVPTMIQAILDNVPNINTRNFSNLKQITYGASPISESLLRKAISVFECDFVQAYGMTETSGAISLLSADDHLHALDRNAKLLQSCGRPVDGVQMAIYNKNGERLNKNEVGQICVKSPSIMKGYWNNADETEATFNDGWLLTGDIGYVDGSGYFYVVDRAKDMIISGGENVYPLEIEKVLLQHPAIAEVAVIGVHDSKYGEKPLAICVINKSFELDSTALILHCRALLAGYKIPRSYLQIDLLPRNASGKVLKMELKNRYKDMESITS
ncbi:long-chain-fatty-acid--CoA ligase [Zhongshania sp.]|uniref:long-chain-fatty-acid--CoA ligase n=1 Tax=Zhongshania sp. TaxID=1971902 RepID=UPI002A7FBEFB|nr:long-chain-fatty-acid--CoA ligase [Zhongshania sp.]